MFHLTTKPAATRCSSLDVASKAFYRDYASLNFRIAVASVDNIIHCVPSEDSDQHLHFEYSSSGLQRLIRQDGCPWRPYCPLSARVMSMVFSYSEFNVSCIGSIEINVTYRVRRNAIEIFVFAFHSWKRV